MFNLPHKTSLPSKLFLAILLASGLVYLSFSRIKTFFPLDNEVALLAPRDEYVTSMNKPASEIVSAHRRNGIQKTLITVPKEEKEEEANVKNYSSQESATPLPATVTVREDDDSKQFSTNESKYYYHGRPQSQQVKLKYDPKTVRNRFWTRSRAAKSVCSNISEKDIYKLSKTSESSSLFAYRRFSWCHIPKVGTTFLTSLNKKIQKDYPKPSYSATSPGHGESSFFLVREPYSRMVSGYIGKIVTNQPWWDYYGRYITATFRANATAKEKKCGNDVSFPEFVKYFIHAQTMGQRKNPHFVPMVERCNPCTKDYDFIVHLETLGDDLSYILATANITADLNFSDEEMTMLGKARSIVSQKKRIVRCEPMCASLRKVWWSFHARGLVSKDIDLPVREDECDSITPEDFAKLSLDARARSVGKIDKRKQKRQALVDLFLQVPLEDRIKVRDLLALDFQLFGYDPQPADLFPELVRT